MAANQLFVVGSLCPGMIHHGLIEKFIKSSKSLLIPGKVLRNQVGYPFLVEESGIYTQGTVCEITDSDLLWQLLNEFHGFNPMQPDLSLSERKTVTAKCEMGSEHEVSVYYFNREKLKAAYDIKQACWMEEMRVSPPLPEKLTDKQRIYIKKLGASSGRDIVPIDLTLYRELMGLELIVDKGRRLALSVLGKEVYKYIGATI